MKRYRISKRWITPALIAAVGAAGVAGTFFAVRAAIGDEPPAEAQERQASTEPQRGPNWWVKFSEEEAKKPLLSSVVINGMRVGAAVEDAAPEACLAPDGEAAWLDLEEARGSELDISPGYLPAGAEFLGGRASKCGDTLVFVEKEYQFPNVRGEDPYVPLQSGGIISVRRSLRPNEQLRIIGPEERFQAMTINGKPAVVRRPLMPDGVDAGLFDGVIAIREASGLTLIQGSGLPWAEVVRIAEGLR